MIQIGPFFYIDNKLIYNGCTLDKARSQADKLDNSYGHDKLYDDYYKDGDYIDYPRGRVVWDKTNNKAIIYIDPCINNNEVIGKVLETFDLKDYVIAFDDHYHCKNCVEEYFKSLKH